MIFLISWMWRKSGGRGGGGVIKFYLRLRRSGIKKKEKLLLKQANGILAFGLLFLKNQAKRECYEGVMI